MVGKCVRISNINARPELNGTIGQVIAYHDNEGRYEVRLFDNSSGLMKPDNLKILKLQPDNRKIVKLQPDNLKIVKLGSRPVKTDVSLRAFNGYGKDTICLRLAFCPRPRGHSGHSGHSGH